MSFLKIRVTGYQRESSELFQPFLRFIVENSGPGLGASPAPKLTPKSDPTCLPGRVFALKKESPVRCGAFQMVLKSRTGLSCEEGRIMNLGR